LVDRVVVVGAGVVGASCAFFAARAGWDVTIVDPLPPGGGTTSRGEGNLLLSDKGAGPELALMQHSRRLWLEVAQELGRDSLELDEKGGLVVATTSAELEALHHFAQGQRRVGVDARPVDGDELWELEPHLARDLPGAVLYPDDLQVQPVLAACALTLAARRLGGHVRIGAEVVAAERDASGRMKGVRLSTGAVVPAEAVVNAAGTWGGVVGQRLGAPVPVHPRRGFVLVTAPVGQLVRHKVYTATYVADVASDDARLQTSTVVEGTRAGTVLIGASRERVGFDVTMSPEVVRRLAAGAVRVLPVLGGVDLMRTYRGFRPYSPDHLPIIGPDPRVQGVIHAVGHEGAGVGLAAATGFLVARHLDGGPVPHGMPVTAFLPDRLVTRQEHEQGQGRRLSAEAS